MRCALRRAQSRVQAQRAGRMQCCCMRHACAWHNRQACLTCHTFSMVKSAQGLPHLHCSGPPACQLGTLRSRSPPLPPLLLHRHCARTCTHARACEALGFQLQPGTLAQVIRSYHGHLSGVYSLALHPKLDVLMTGGRDSVCRVWDMRTKVQVCVCVCVCVRYTYAPKYGRACA